MSSQDSNAFHIKALSKNTLVYGLGNAANQLIGFLLLPVFTAYLTPQEYGIIGMFTFFSFLASQIFALGFNVSLGMVYFEKSQAFHRSSVIWTAFMILTLSAVILNGLTFYFRDWIGLSLIQNSKYGSLLFIWVLGSSVSIILPQSFRYALQFQQRAKTFAFASVISATTTTVFTVLLVVYKKQGVSGYIHASAIGSLITFLIFLILGSKNIPLSFSIVIAKKLIRYGIVMIPSFFLLFIVRHSGRYLLQYFTRLEDVGVYVIGFNIGMATSLFVSAFQTSWYPYFNSFFQNQNEAKQIFGRISTYYLYCFGIILVGFFSFSQPVVKIMTEESFHGAWHVIGFVSLGFFLNGIFILLLPPVYFARKVYLVNLVQFLAALASVLFSYFLIPVFGMIAAAIAYSLANLIMVLLQYLITLKATNFRIAYEWRRILNVLLLILPFLFLPFWIGDQNVWISLFSAIALFLTFSGLVFLQLTASEKSSIRVALKGFF